MSETANSTRDSLRLVARRRHFWIAGALALVVAASGISWWAMRPGAPTLLGDRSSVGFDAAARPWAQAAGFAGIAVPGPGTRHETLVFHGPPAIHFRKNTAKAHARVAVCVANGTPVGVAYLKDLGSACSHVRYVKDGTRLHWAEGAAMREYLIIVVTPSRAGIASVDRVTYDYETPSGESGLDRGPLGYTIRAT